MLPPLDSADAPPMPEPFLWYQPNSHPLPIIASLPHSGLHIPSAIVQQLHPTYQHYLPHQDWHLNHLYDFLPELSIPLLEAQYSRYVVDLNRSLKQPWYGSFWTAVVPEQTAFQQPLYNIPPSEAEIQQRINTFYQPYHDRLQQLIQQALTRFDQVYLFDLHSFGGLITEDICLGNAHGQTCSEATIATVAEAFASQGYQVVQNKVFSGGYITRTYGQLPQVEALQIEIRYQVYLETEQLAQPQIPTWDCAKFHQAKANLISIFQQLGRQLLA